MAELYTFLSLFSEPVALEKDSNVIIDRLVIPKIQRPYAQGRTDGVSTYVRKTLLTNLFTDLKDGTPFDFNFIYGIVRPQAESHVLELLDGQQRLTTLFLLYWYAANRELSESDARDKLIRDCLKKFVYETRQTSSVFCRKLASYRVNLEGHLPSRMISKSKWYFKSFDRDSTICAMLTMLDAIHQQYETNGITDLNVRLDTIRFYVKSLGVYNLSEELYIKMNARGLQLSPFENFKADLTNYVTTSSYSKFQELVPLYKEGAKDLVSFQQNFAIKLDAKWVDLFWKKGAEDYDASYMSFFSRFFACKYILLCNDNDRDIRNNKTLKSLTADAESRITKNEYFGFGSFKAVLDLSSEVVCELDRVLDILYGNDYQDKKRLISTLFVSPWERGNESEFDDFLYNTKSRFTYVKLILFGAFIEFVDAFKSFNYVLFKEWMRVVWNIVENTNIDSLTPVASLIRKFSDLIHFVSKDSRDAQSFYTALSKWSKEEDSRAVAEEVRKAGRIAESMDWLPVFTDAEHHEYLRGMVLFFYREGMSLPEYVHSFENVSTMFNKAGISAAFCEYHLLIRAIVSRYNTWGELNEQYFTERAETNKYLKNKLASQDKVGERIRAMLTSVACLNSVEEIKESLRQYILDAEEFVPWESTNENDPIAVQYAVNRLRNDVAIWDWISRQESICRVYWFAGHIMFAVPKAWYAKIALDTKRAAIADMLHNDYSFSYEDKGQQDSYKKYREVYGKDLWLKKVVGDKRIRVGFCMWHQVFVQIHFPDTESASSAVLHFENGKVKDDQSNVIQLPTIGHFPSQNTVEELRRTLDAIQAVISEESK